jgi:nickel/cobalt transporter (NicO) family protein
MDLYAAQRWIYASLTSQLTEFAHGHGWWPLAWVLPMGVVFGAVHALTPGQRQNRARLRLLPARSPADRTCIMKA